MLDIKVKFKMCTLSHWWRTATVHIKVSTAEKNWTKRILLSNKPSSRTDIKLMLKSSTPHSNTDLSFSLSSTGHHDASWVQGWQAAGLQAHLWDDDQAPGCAPQQWFLGAPLPRHAQGRHQRRSGTASRWHLQYGCQLFFFPPLDGAPVKLMWCTCIGPV